MEVKLVRVSVVFEPVVLTSEVQVGVFVVDESTPEMILVALVKRFHIPVKVKTM
jgi:hypothetical protein